MASVAFIGLGRMGLGMAGRLLDANHKVRVFNRTVSRADTLVRRGARQCLTAREACVGADAVVSMVSDDPASRATWLGSDGVLAANLAPGALAIECSTLSYNWVMELGAACAAQGLCYVDAPVTGLPDAAAAGELTLLVGANPKHLADARALLGAFSRSIIHFGPVGTGTAYKLLVNMLGAVQIASAAETMAIAERIGLDLGTVAEALATGQAASPQVVRNTRRIAEGQHDRDISFTPQLRLKDVEYALELGQQFGIGSPFGALAARVFRQLCHLGHAQANESTVIEVAKRQPVE
jgi:3-hydroxyisobutyrate dehydrogenase